MKNDFNQLPPYSVLAADFDPKSHIIVMPTENKKSKKTEKSQSNTM